MQAFVDQAKKADEADRLAEGRLDKRGVRALKGYGGFVMVEGDAGIGKSRLLDEFQRLMLRRGAAVFTGAYRANSIGPGTGLRRAVEQLLRIDRLNDQEALEVVRQRLKKLGILSDEFVHMLMRALRPGRTNRRNRWSRRGTRSTTGWRRCCHPRCRWPNRRS